MKKKISIISIILMLVLILCSCSSNVENTDVASSNDAEMDTDLIEKYEGATIINLKGDRAYIDENKIDEYDYTWHTDPSIVHDDVKGSPSEYFTGSLPDELSDLYIDHELYYYPELDTSKFTVVDYDGDREWAYYYCDGENDEYIYSTLPYFGKDIPTYMMHSEEEALKNKVLHITKEGTYVLTGTWNGQIKIDLGDKEDVFSDESKKVRLILSNANIDCTVAPGIIYENLYECDNTWKDREEKSCITVVTNAGASLTVADGTENTVSGNNIFRMLKPKYKDKDSDDKIQKKARKYDGALYSCVTLEVSGEVNGTGKLNINSNFEGLDSELHMVVNYTDITINSQDDGINVNEGNVSTFIFNGGNLTINHKQGYEGDGIDSNGYIVVNDGIISVNNVVAPDNSLDSDDGIYYNGGEIYIDGEKADYEVGQVYHDISSSNQGKNGGFNPNDGGKGNMTPPDMQGDTPPEKPDDNGNDFDLSKFKTEVNNLPDTATIDDVLSLLGMDKGRGTPPN